MNCEIVEFLSLLLYQKENLRSKKKNKKQSISILIKLLFGQTLSFKFFEKEKQKLSSKNLIFIFEAISFT